MNKFLDKFGVYDIFSMLIPGTLILGTFFLFFDNFDAASVEAWEFKEYGIFFATSYLIGLLMYELGAILDDCVYDNLLYGGNPSKVYFVLEADTEVKVDAGVNKNKTQESKWRSIICAISALVGIIVGSKKTEVIRNKGTTAIIKNIRNKVCKEYQFDSRATTEEINDCVYQICVNSLESKGLNGKMDKMLSISELARSMVTGLLFILFALALYFIHSLFEGNAGLIIMTFCKMILTLIMIRVFWSNKRRYEQHRYAIVFRMYAISFLKI